jgi:phosphopentomutase
VNLVFKRALLIILDGVGIGALPDADLYGDAGSNTLGNLARAVGGFDLSNLASLGLGNIAPLEGMPPAAEPLGAYGVMREASPGKDSTSGHWEMTGVQLKAPFPTYPDGFPPEVMQAFEKAIGRGTLGNYAASGTVIIQDLGDEHVRTGKPIVYTSADSVFQIAAHEDVIPVEELYDMCRKARKILAGKHAVGRVIARPFVGSSGNYTRTTRRKDFSLEPIDRTLLDLMSEAGYDVVTAGKVCYLFASRGVTESVKAPTNKDVTDSVISLLGGDQTGLLFANLVDFDMLWGHRNDVEGFYRGLREFDRRLPEIMSAMRDDDVLFITADHGNDPTTPSTDHSREQVPVLAYGAGVRPGVDLGVRASFADLGATIAENFGIALKAGKSFLSEIAASRGPVGESDNDG